MEQQPSSQSGNSEAETDLTLIPWNTLAPWTTRLTWQLRLKFFLTGVLFPVLCLCLIASSRGSSTVLSPWQSGEVENYVGVLLSWPALFVFTPLLAYSFVCLTRWCLWPFQTNDIVHWLGLLTGAILALTFTLLLMVTTAYIAQLMAIIVAPILALLVYLIGLAIKKKLIRKRFSIAYLIGSTTVLAVILAVLSASGKHAIEIVGGIGGTFVAAYVLVVGSASTLGFVTFCRATVASSAIYRSQRNESTEKHKWLIAGFILWLGGYLLSWKFAIDLMMVEYAKLPTSQPNCFVSSAAANGHQSLVGSFAVNSSRANERTNINRQMQRLKFLEFALAAGLPRTHRVTRAIYNRLGPLLADICRSNVWFSDATFLALKPIEWLAIGLRYLAGVSKEQVAKIYCD